MNPASHLLIAAPCYFTFLLSFSSSLQRKRRKFPVSVPFYLSRYTPSRSRDRSIRIFLLLFSTRRRKMSALLMEIRRPFVSSFLIRQALDPELGTCVSNGCIDLPESFRARDRLSGKRIQIAEGDKVPLQRGSAMLEPLALKIHNSGEIWYFPPRPLCATYFRKLFLPQKCLENA